MNPNLFDTHAHFEESRDAIIASLTRARDAGVANIVAIGGDEKANRGASAAFSIAKENVASYPKVYKAIGWDYENFNLDLPALDLTDCVAIGEIGLDYYYGGDSRREQQKFFSEQLELAKANNLPVVIHTREADDDTLGILREIPSRGIIHCFTGKPKFCRDLLNLGFYISISGIVTFRAAENVRESSRVVPNDRLLIETDSPFLAPVPNRGRENEPAFLVHTAKFLATLRDMSFEELAMITSANARDAFHLE